MLVNNSLYLALKQRFGEVRVSNQGMPRRVVRYPGVQDPVVEQTGESYNVCCPFCGDTRHRLSISCDWLAKRSDGSRQGGLINCYNENCRGVYEETFWRPFAKALDSGATLDYLSRILSPPPPPPEPMRLPVGCRPLQELPDDHPAHEFVRTKYPNLMGPRDLGTYYQALYTDQYDERFRLAQHRIIFPIFRDGKFVTWQGRTINPVERTRWYLPPGFPKAIYRYDEVKPDEIPVLTEGITSAIGAGRDGLALFGKTLDEARAQQLALRYEFCIIATDPETFTPNFHDPKRVQEPAARVMKQVLDRYTRRPNLLIEWPEDCLEAGRFYNRLDQKGLHPKVPDSADLGIARMAEILALTKHKHGIL